MPRNPRQLRPVKIRRHYPSAAPGSVLIEVGNTRVLCTASISTDLPSWLKQADPPQGWVTAEYSMLPGSTPDRQRRGPNSRATEIQRLIGRALRASVDLHKMPNLLITCDCDVIQADGGTRTASITGAFVALSDAIQHARKLNLISSNPILGPVAAISVGIVDQRIVLDLDYNLDSRAEVDMNIVMNHRDQFIEIQGTGEHGTFDHEQLNQMLDHAAAAIRKLLRTQRAALRK